MPWLGVLVCGDYLSPVEIPMLSPGGSGSAYRATLSRLAELVRAAAWVVPGHGAPLSAQRALEILGDDDAYLRDLAEDPGKAVPPRGRSSPTQKRIHEHNLGRLNANGPS
jgi:glyoxylase-like metal-dependent hydrolase (beta-lactamase superfamily II)